jgi:hypothetical protein
MTDDETARLEKWKADIEAKTRALMGPPISEEEDKEMWQRLHGGNAFSKKYSESNGCEMAILRSDGAIEIIHSSTAGEGRAHGTQLFPRDHKKFKEYWQRHDFDNQKTATHVIMKRFDEKTKEWTELGQEWI